MLGGMIAGNIREPADRNGNLQNLGAKHDDKKGAVMKAEPANELRRK